MAININDIKTAIDLLTKKDRRGMINSKEFTDAVNFASVQLFNDRYPRKNSRGESIKAGWPSTQKIQDDIRPFIKSDYKALSKEGKFMLPEDYEHFISFDVSKPSKAMRECLVADQRPIPKKARLFPITHDQVQTVIDDNTIYPDYHRIYYVLYSDHFLFLPGDIGQLRMDYFKIPEKAEWAYTIVNGRQVYDPINSIDLEWDQKLFTEIVVKTCSLLGVNITDNVLMQWSEAKNTQGV